MTTIIALCNGDSIYIGSDSRTTSRDMIVAEDTVKLIQYSDYIIGVSGIAVVNQTLGLWHKEIPIHTEKDVYILQESIISLMKDKNCMYSLKESDMIILTRYGPYVYSGEDATFEKKENYISIGSGKNFVYGYLHALEDAHKNSFPRAIQEKGGPKIIEEGLKIASRYDAGTNDHMHLLFL